MKTTPDRRCHIYCRISTSDQFDNNSVDVQKNALSIFAKNNKLTVKNIDIEISSSYTILPHKLEKLINASKCTHLLFYSVDRFCRNVDNGISLVEKAVKFNCIVVFFQEKLVINKDNYKSVKKTLIKKLKEASDESAKLGMRIRESKKRNRELGLFNGGRLPFATTKIPCYSGPKKKYKVVFDVNYTNVLNFIHACKITGTKSTELDKLMDACGGDVEIYYDAMDPNKLLSDNRIKLSYENKSIDKLVEPLSNAVIAGLLNEYEIKTDTVWTASKIASLLRNNTKYKKVDDEKVHAVWSDYRDYDMDEKQEEKQDENDNAYNIDNAVKIEAMDRSEVRNKYDDVVNDMYMDVVNDIDLHINMLDVDEQVKKPKK